MEVAKVETEHKSPVVVAFVLEVKYEAIEVARTLRCSFPVMLDVMGRGLGAQLKYAGNVGDDNVVIVGPKEVKEGKFTLRNMESGAQESFTLEEIEEKLGQERSH